MFPVPFSVHCAKTQIFRNLQLTEVIFGHLAIIYYLSFNPVHARNETTGWLSASTHPTKTMKSRYH